MKHTAALVGLGKISDAHIQGWKVAPNAELKVLVDSDGARAESKAYDNHIPEFGSSFEALLSRSDIDIIDVATPHYLHAPYAIAALKAGKHVLVEKPVATRLADADEMIRTAKETGKILMVAEPVKFSPSFQRAAKLIQEGALGSPFLFTTRAQFYVPPNRFQGANTGWRGDAQKMGGGVLLESGIHNIAAATYLMGPVESVSAFKGKQTRSEITVEDTISIILRFKSGAIGQGSFSWGARWSEYTDEFTVFGTEGVTGSNVRTGRIFYDNGRGELKEWIETAGVAGKAELIVHFLDCIDNDKVPLTDAPSETENMRVVMAAYRSADEGRAVKVDDVRS